MIKLKTKTKQKRYMAFCGLSVVKLTIFDFKSTPTMRISEGICEYNTGYVRIVSNTQQPCGLISSPSSNIAKNFDTIRLHFINKSKV